MWNQKVNIGKHVGIIIVLQNNLNLLKLVDPNFILNSKLYLHNFKFKKMMLD